MSATAMESCPTLGLRHRFPGIGQGPPTRVKRDKHRRTLDVPQRCRSASKRLFEQGIPELWPRRLPCEKRSFRKPEGAAVAGWPPPEDAVGQGYARDHAERAPGGAA